jgi:ABC-2 type transport system permease protein
MTPLVPLVAMVRKDLQLFFRDRRSVIVSFVVPIAIGSFFGAVFAGGGQNREAARIAIGIVDQDDSSISRAIIAGAKLDTHLLVATPGEDEAHDLVRRGTTAVAIVIPKGFGEASGRAFFGGGAKPELALLHDPSKATELAMVRGVMTQHVLEAVATATAGPGAGRLAMPYRVREEAVTAGSNIAYNGYAHSFAGMAIQFLLFAMANLGVDMLLERQRGLWSRLRSAPVSKLTLLSSKAVSGTLISALILLVSFGFAMVVFRVRIQGSLAGFIGISIACAMMAATFGLLVAALGNSPATARGVTTLAVLMMVMLGGAWVPSFIFPPWLQQLTVVVPVRWAVDGLDAMTWRGLGLSVALMPIAVLLVFAAGFWTVAATRFRWEES